MDDVPPLWDRLLGVVVFGWVIASVRLLMDFVMPDAAITMYVGVFYTVPLVLAWIGIRRRWGLIAWRPMAWTMVCIAVLVWGMPNAISYTTGQFLGWEHGRFEPNERAAPIQDTALGKVGMGLLHGFGSSVFASVLCTVVGSLFIWVPRRTVRG